MLSPPPNKTPFDKDGGSPNGPWIEWLTSVFTIAGKYKGTGTTSERPTNGLNVGDWYWDSTLQYPVWWSGTNWKNSVAAIV